MLNYQVFEICETETHFTSRHSFYDDYRYINFSRTLVNEGNGFDIRDGIFRVPVTGLYMFTVHALPMEDRPFMVQIHLNDQSVAAFSNGESGKFTISYGSGTQNTGFGI